MRSSVEVEARPTVVAASRSDIAVAAFRHPIAAHRVNGFGKPVGELRDRAVEQNRARKGQGSSQTRLPRRGQSHGLARVPNWGTEQWLEPFGLLLCPPVTPGSFKPWLCPSVHSPPWIPDAWRAPWSPSSLAPPLLLGSSAPHPRRTQSVSTPGLGPRTSPGPEGGDVTTPPPSSTH